MHTTDLNIHLTASHDVPSAEYSHHSSGLRTNTDTVILKAIREQYPEKNIITTPERGCDLLGYAAAGHALATPVTSPQECLPRKWRMYAAPARRLNGNVGGLVDEVLFGKYQYAWKDHEFILYLVDGRDGDSSFPVVRNNYIVGDGDAASQLILEVGKFTSTLHNEIWVFNKGYWSKDAELWKNVSKSSWDNVILDAEMKQTLIDDVTRFFDSRQTYANLKIAWKRGIIFHGPAGERFILVKI